MRRNINDRVVQHPRRYQLNPVAGSPDVFDLVPTPGTVTEPGTAVNKALLQPIEDNLAAAGTFPLFEGLMEFEKVDGELTAVVEKRDNGSVFRRTDLTKDDGVLFSTRVRLYDTDGVAVVKDYTDTLVRTEGSLARVERTVTV